MNRSTLVPAWRRIGDLDRLLQPDELARLLREAGLDVVAASPVYLRAKPDTGALLGLRLVLRDPAGEVTEWPAYLRTHDEPRARQLAAKWHAERAIGTPFGPGVRLLPTGRSVLFLFPNDAALRGIRFIHDKQKLKRALAGLDALVGDGERVSGKRTQLETVRYKPERRLIQRARLCIAGADGGEREQGAFLRFFTDGRGASIDRLARALRDGPLGERVPRSFGALLDGRLHVEAEVLGAPLLDQALGGRADAREIVALLEDFHRAPAEFLPVLELDATVARAGENAQSLAFLAPALAGDAAHVHALLADAARECRSDAAPATLHGDCHVHQFLVASGGLTVVDFERAVRGDPLVDLGNLRAHLLLLARRHPDAARHLDRFGDDVVERTLRHAPRDAAARLPFFIASGLLERALLPLRALAPDGESSAADTLAMARRWLARAPSHAVVAAPRFFSGGGFLAFHPRSDGPWPGRIEDPARGVVTGEYDPRTDTFVERDPRTDRALPALRTALDGGELVAYRPGRRATVRFGGGASFAKLLRPKRAAELAKRHAALEALRAAAGPDFPSIPALTTAVLPRGILVFAAARGTALDVLLRADVVDPNALASVARGLAAFHAAVVDTDAFPGAAAARSLPEWIEIVRPHDAALAIDATALARELGEAPPCARPALIHGDCHDRNVFVAGDELSLIDLDLCGLGDPRADAGNLAAHLLLRALHDGASTARGWEVAARFLCAYGQASRLAGAEALVLSTARALVRLACVHRFRRAWNSLCPQLLRAAREAAQRLTAATPES